MTSTTPAPPKPLSIFVSGACRRAAQGTTHSPCDLEQGRGTRANPCDSIRPRSPASETAHRSLARINIVISLYPVKDDQLKPAACRVLSLTSLLSGRSWFGIEFDAEYHATLSTPRGPPSRAA